MKIIILVVIIIGNGITLLFVPQDIRDFGFSLSTIFQIVISGLILVGGVYILLKFDHIFPKHRLRAIQAFVALFFVDTILGAGFSLNAIQNPASFSPPLTEAEINGAKAGMIGGAAFSLLILFVIIRLINIVSGKERTKPEPWMTALSWALVILAAIGMVTAF